MSFYIKIANGLLEPKHCAAMGEAVWLYMLLQDKNTSVNENGEGKVLGNRPVVFDDDIQPILGISRATYKRWINTLRDAGYIKTVRTPRGLIVMITKAKKFNKREGSKSPTTTPKKKSDGSNPPTDGSKSNRDGSKSNIQYKTIQHYTKTNNNTTDVVLEDADRIGVLYYQVIKKLKLPVRNHNNVKSTIKKIQAEGNHKGNIKYLEFMLNSFEDAVFDYKPHVNEALEIYTKRNQIINAVKRAGVPAKKGGVYKV